MHEMSIVEALLETVSREARSHAATGVRTVRVRVGALRQVVPETLVFCYDAAVRGTALAGSRLDIEPLAAEARCRTCRLSFAVEDNCFTCPRCGAFGAELLQGNELELVSLELATGG